jgi:alginate O-acetyltransferase complex protein AlgI
MLFSSPEFLFAFLPAFLILYFAVGQRSRNGVLFFASLLFYYTTSGELTAILVLSVLFNYYLSLKLQRAENGVRKAYLWSGVLINLLPLLYYKYSKFFLMVASDVLSRLGWHTSLPAVDPILPIGISFFTFQAVSYVADVYLGRVKAARNLIDFGMYHSCFPQLIAGPIVRYEEIETQVHRRDIRLADLYNGVTQFCFGLAKKVILADNMGFVADRMFKLPPGSLSSAAAWTGVAAYTLQIYFDFSGYSDMAIGLGRILGFRYPENFNQPYRSRSVTEFWRRWHMTLSRWFRDYVYISLGGNRLGFATTLFNLSVVFFLCGLWHGAAYTFVVWGLYHGGLLIAERLGKKWLRCRIPGLVGWIYTTVAVMVGWVLFRSESLAAAAAYLTAMCDLRHLDFADPLVLSTMTVDKITYMALGLVCSLVPYEWFVSHTEGRYFFPPGVSLFALAVAALAIVMMSVNGFSPFIYFRF